MNGNEKSDRGREPEQSQKRFTPEERATYRVVLKRLATAKLPRRTATVGALEAKGLLF